MNKIHFNIPETWFVQRTQNLNVFMYENAKLRSFLNTHSLCYAKLCPTNFLQTSSSQYNYYKVITRKRDRK